MEFMLALSPDSMDAVTALDMLYKDGFKFLLSEWYGSVLKEIHGRTPLDMTTKQGKSKSFDEHIQSQWALSMDLDDMSAVFGNPAAYGPTLEEGKYPRPGPRTVAEGAGIYSRQAPRGIIGPLLDDPKVLQDSMDMIVERLGSRLDTFLKRRA